MKRGLIVILSFILLLPIYHASEISTLEADGDIGYRQVGLIWSTDSPTEEGTIFEIWISNETIIETANATKHSQVMVGNVSGISQPVMGEWYDDCQYNFGDAEWIPVHRDLDGTAVVPPGTIGVNCTLTGIPSGTEIHLAVLLVNPSNESILSPSISSSSTSSDEEIIQLSDKISYLEYTIKYCEGIIKSIDNRGWDTKNAIEWKKFEAGMI